MAGLRVQADLLQDIDDRLFTLGRGADTVSQQPSAMICSTDMRGLRLPNGS